MIRTGFAAAYDCWSRRKLGGITVWPGDVENANERAVSDVVIVDCDDDGVMSLLYADPY